ncbi:hypothetical protein C8F01DRAFT_723816 [Mycena amicta]|nr:hypothetical protein C8F01DRAFT_723816 [Mycena amicta]
MRRMARAVAAQNQLDEAVVMPPPSPHPRIPAPFLHISNPPLAVDDDDDADLDGLAYARRGPRDGGLSASGGSQTHSRSSGRSSGSGSGSNRPPYSPTPYSAIDGLPQIPKTHTSSSAKKPKSKSRSTRSKSSATSSTLASPSAAAFPPSPLNPASAASREDFGAFVHAKTDMETEFDGTPGGFEPDGADAYFDGTSESEHAVYRIRCAPRIDDWGGSRYLTPDAQREIEIEKERI